MQDKKISIIVAVKENEKDVENYVKEIIKIKNEYNFKNLEIIFIDDFSNDSSWEKIKSVRREYTDMVKGIKLGRNYGQQQACYVGMKYVLNSDYVITMDCDLEDDPNNIPKLINNLNEKKCDCILTITTFKGPIFYRFFSRVFYFIMGTWSNIKEIKRHTHLRLYSKSCVKSILKLNPSFFHLTHSLSCINAKFDYLLVEKFYKERKSSYSINKKIKLAISNIFDLSNLTTHVLIFLFATIILITLLYYLYNIYIYIFFGTLSGFLPLVSILITNILIGLISFFYLNYKLNSITNFLYRGINKQFFDDYFDIIETIGFN